LLIVETFFGLPRIITRLARRLRLRRKADDQRPYGETSRNQAVPGYGYTRKAP
jgi:hypothetical protein